MTVEQTIINAGVQIVKELIKELPRTMNRADRDYFKNSLTNKVTAMKEVLIYENGEFTTHTKLTNLSKTGELEAYMKEMLPEGATSAKLGLITVNAGPFLLGFVKFNPTTEKSAVDYFTYATPENVYLGNYLRSGIADRLIKKHASFLLPTLTVQPSELDLTAEEINEIINNGNGHFVSVSEEDVERLGLDKGAKLELDEVTSKRIEKQLIDLEGVNIQVKE